MNYRLIFNTWSKILLIEAASMCLPLLVAIYYGESLYPFLMSIGILLLCVVPLWLTPVKDKRFQARDGFVTVASIWIIMSVFGALPFYFSGYFQSFMDCFFEAVSGFTTTGATILSDIEALPKGILFWRSFTHWLGGMGVLVLATALFKTLGEGAHHLMRAETPGPSPGKLVSQIARSSKILYIIYLGITVLEIISLMLAGLDLYHAATVASATAGTGGFAVLNNSIAGYQSAAVEWIVTVFMILFGMNFNIYFYLLTKKFKQAWKMSEIKLYLAIIAAASILIFVDVFFAFELYDSVEICVRDVVFQVSSIITTTGFATTDFNLWPTFSHSVLLILMIIGACAGSTAGGVKCSRILILGKSIGAELKRMLHPKSVTVLRVEGERIPDSTVNNVIKYICIYFAFIVISTLLVAVDNFSILENLSAVLTTIGNVGPGLGTFGPAGNFSAFSVFSKLVLSICMLAGRLELFPILILFSPATWKRK